MPNSENQASSFIPFEEEPVIQEKCGVVGVAFPNVDPIIVGGDDSRFEYRDFAPIVARNALISLQHRGQDSAGITIKNGVMETHHGMGLIPQAIPEATLTKYGKSRKASAHTRYSTYGAISGENAQPVQLPENPADNPHALSMAHNGNLTNVDWIRENTIGEYPKDTSDTVLLTAYLLQQRPQYSSWEETFQQELPNIEGAYSAVALTEDDKLHGFRDIQAIRPFALGSFPAGGTILASESVAIENVGADYVRQIERGEIVTIHPDGELSSRFYGEPKRERFCTLENVYVLRPESFNNGIRVRNGRRRSGELLADRMKAKGINFQAAVPVFSSGYHAGHGFADHAGVPMIDAIGTDHYVGRTFIMPGQENRSLAVNGKHKVMPEDIEGLELAEIDDSCMRTTTARKITKGLYDNGAAKVHPGLAAPPAQDICNLGISLRQKSELPASQMAGASHEEIELFMAGMIGSDTATFLTREETSEAFGREEKEMCTFCFGGVHPIHGEQEQFPQKERSINGKPKLAVFISGGGTNLQKIIDGTQSGLIDAEIVSVVSNNPEAYGLQHAKNANIPTAIVDSKGRMKDPIKRAEYEQDLLEVITNNPPDALVLAGFMTVLGDEFIKAVQELEIPVINLHPGLLTAKDGEKVATSRGLMPVLRGTNAIADAYNRNLRASGVTVHQILPGNTFDTGPVILKQEVHRRLDDTPESWEARIHEAEYQALPTAISRVLHVMKHNIDVSKGEYPW